MPSEKNAADCKEQIASEMTDRANKPEAWMIEAVRQIRHHAMNGDPCNYEINFEIAAQVIAEAHAAHCKEVQNGKYDVGNGDVGAGSTYRNWNSSGQIPEVSGMTAQELYKVWAQEHADDVRGDWPIRFADYCLSAANTRIAELERSLEKYGAHRFHCPVIAGAVACSCGLDAAKEASVALSYTRPNKAEGK